ncbi:hypothetical protein RhiLY_07035 [Ceratobasidium sp. AG-Ba]|nr:hypothetical protein RhiLY_07035 [Ceratobasidium sp. AG-Ba]
MFEYLSFLRPPPARSPLTQQITLVPQIANDLRTELCEHEYDIYFAWQHPNGHLSRVKFTKLTTWRPGGMYKPLNVPLPAEVRPGDSWRLCLTVHPTTASLVLDLSQPAFGQLPFAVTSMPIDIELGGATTASTASKNIKKSRQTKPPSAGGKGSVSINTERASQNAQFHTSKQERIERFYSLPLALDSDITRVLRITEQTSFDLDKASLSKIWDSGVAVSAWLARLLDPRNDPPASSSLAACLRKRLLPAEPRAAQALRVIELGAGTGLVSLILGALLSPLAHVQQVLDSDAAERLYAQILATDLPSAIELIEHNRTSNEHLFTIRGPEGSEARVIEVRGAALDWDQPVPDDVWGGGSGFDVIVMADVTYNTSSFNALLDTVISLLSRSVFPIILLAYKCRDMAERTLWSDAAARGVLFTQVDTVRGVREPEVEIWLGGWEKDVAGMWGDVQN